MGIRLKEIKAGVWSLKIKNGLASVIFAATVIAGSTPMSLAFADTLCSDGWVSKSSGSGTCSWHGGIAESYQTPAQTKAWKKLQAILNTPQPKRKFSDCAQMRKYYRTGVARDFDALIAKENLKYQYATLKPEVYALNSRLDTNRNGMVCEVKD